MSLVNTPYDDVFRTLLNDCSELIIPVINEVFGENYCGKEEILFYPNEHFINNQDGEKECITDTCFILKSKESKKYHIECQSTSDSSMLIRMFEYDSQIALDDSEIKDSTLTVKFPNSVILFLRSNLSTPDKMTVKIETLGGTVYYDIPVMKAQKYKINEIFDKNLLFLIPFYIFSYESNFTEYNEDKEKLEVLKREYEYIKNKLEELCLRNVISEYTKHIIVEMSNKVLEHIANKYLEVKKGVKSIMGGKILEYEAKTILRQGIEQGIEQGRKEGRLELIEGLISACKDFGASISEVVNKLVEKCSLTEEEARKYVEEYWEK